MITIKCNEEGQAFAKTSLPFSVRVIHNHLFVAGSEQCHHAEQHAHDWFVISSEVNDRSAYERINQ